MSIQKKLMSVFIILLVMIIPITSLFSQTWQTMFTDDFNRASLGASYTVTVSGAGIAIITNNELKIIQTNNIDRFGVVPMIMCNYDKMRISLKVKFPKTNSGINLSICSNPGMYGRPSSTYALVVKQGVNGGAIYMETNNSGVKFPASTNYSLITNKYYGMLFERDRQNHSLKFSLYNSDFSVQIFSKIYIETDPNWYKNINGKYINLFFGGPATIPLPESVIVDDLKIEQSIGNAYYVTPTGAGTKGGSSWANACSNIMQAVNLAKSNDTIYVANGIYNEAVILSKTNVSLIGTNNAVINGTGNAYALAIAGKKNKIKNMSFLKGNQVGLIITRNSVSNQIRNCYAISNPVGVSLITNNNTVISNLLVKRSTTTGIYLDNCSGNIIKNSYLSKNNEGIIIDKASKNNQVIKTYSCSNAASGIRVRDSENNTIIKCVSYSNKQSGIAIDDFSAVAKNNLVQSNYTFLCSWGVRLQGVSNICKYNIAYSNRNAGIQVNPSAPFSLIKKNEVFNNIECNIGPDDSSSDISVISNKIHGGAIGICSGILTYGISGKNWLIAGNEIYNHTGTGIYADISTNVKINGNRVYNNTTATGVYIINSSSITLVNNIITNNCINLYTNTVSQYYAFGNIINQGLCGPVLPPLAPVWISAAPISTNQINLLWGDVSNETSYTLFRNTASSTTKFGRNANVTSYNDTGLTANTKYFYWLKAYNTSGGSPYSAVISNTTPALSAPIWISAAPISTNQINLLWRDISNETSYTLFRNVSSSTIGATKFGRNANVTNYNDTGLLPGTQYFYWLKACSVIGNSLFSLVIFTSTLSSDSIPPVTTASKTNGTYVGAIEVILSSVDTGSGVYKIYYTIDETDPKTSSTVQSDVSPVTVQINKPTTLKFYAKDNAGNSETVQTKIYEIIKTPPGDAAIYNNYFDLTKEDFARIIIMKPGNTEINIYNMRGVLVKSYAKRYYYAGSIVEWNGTIKDTAKKAGAGIYIVIIKGDNIDKKLKMIIKK